MPRLSDKVAIITGAGTGLGRSAAVRFATEGARVVGCGRTAATLEETAEAVAAAGGEFTAVTGDIGVSADVDRIVAACVETYGRVDILVNNAAILLTRREADAGSLGSLLETTEEDWEQVMGTNLRGVFLLCRKVIPLMKEQGGGVILNVSSIAAQHGFSTMHHYGATKGGLSAFSKGLAASYGGNNIRVNTMITGGFLSPAADDFMHLFQPLLDDPLLRYRWCSLGRLASSDEIAPAMAFLCSDEASYIHGADIPVDGGMSANAVPNFGPRTATPGLFADDLLEAASTDTGLDDYGDRGFVEGLTVFTEEIGRASCRERV